MRVIARPLLGNNGLSPQQFQDLPGEDSELFGLILLIANSLWLALRRSRAFEIPHLPGRVDADALTRQHLLYSDGNLRHGMKRHARSTIHNPVSGVRHECHHTLVVRVLRSYVALALRQLVREEPDLQFNRLLASRRFLRLRFHLDVLPLECDVHFARNDPSEFDFVGQLEKERGVLANGFD